jgi:hypothetical protein
MERRRLAFVGALLLACLASLVALSTLLASNYDPEETELLLKVHLEAHEPYRYYYHLVRVYFNFRSACMHKVGFSLPFHT